MEAAKPKVIACIPAYSEEHTIASVIVKAQKHVDKIIVCDDGSKDMTAEIAEKLGAVVVKHDRNRGYGAALATLFEKAREADADIMVTLDGDGQHNPDDMPKLIAPLISGDADIAIGSRFLDAGGEETPRYRKIGVKAITNISNSVSYPKLTDAQSGFRAYNKKAFNSIIPSETQMGVSTEILMKASQLGLRVKEVPIKISYAGNTSTHNPIYQGLDVILSTIKHLSIRHPLLFYGIPGFTSLMISAFFLFWTLEIFATKRVIETNIALVAVAAAVLGLMLMTTAILLWVIISVIREKQ